MTSATDLTDSSGFTQAQARRTEVTLASYAGNETPARNGLTDHDPTVRAAALSALDRLRTLTSDDVSHALNDVDLRVRRRACELAALMPVTGGASPEIDRVLLSYVQTGDETMAELSAWSLGERHQQQNLGREEDTNPAQAGEIQEQPATETDEKASAVEQAASVVSSDVMEIVHALGETVYHHPDALVREAAVAALGCIGTPEAKDPIFHALGDKATVRRRAVIALAAFEGDDVEAALAQATGDRDWQVRQAAEDLLA